MCCRTSVYPLDPETAEAILRVGSFQPVSWPPKAGFSAAWERLIVEEGAKVTASLTADTLDLVIAPSISAYSQHADKRITAGVYFEIAAKYAEKVGGRIIQRATVIGCKEASGKSGLVIANYPDLPLDFGRICAGFQAVLLGENNGHRDIA